MSDHEPTPVEPTWPDDDEEDLIVELLARVERLEAIVQAEHPALWERMTGGTPE